MPRTLITDRTQITLYNNNILLASGQGPECSACPVLCLKENDVSNFSNMSKHNVEKSLKFSFFKKNSPHTQF